MSDIYWYYDQRSWEVIIGIRGGREIRMNRFEADRCLWKLHTKLGRMPEDEEYYRFLLQQTEIESQYIDFEEVKPEIKLLT